MSRLFEDSKNDWRQIVGKLKLRGTTSTSFSYVDNGSLIISRQHITAELIV